MRRCALSIKKTATEIRGIRSVNSAEELKNYLHTEILNNSLTTAAVRPYVAHIDNETVLKLIDEACLEDPVGIPLPVAAEITAFPNEGNGNVFEISLDYMLSAVKRTSMTEKTAARVRELTAGELPETPAMRALALAETLHAQLSENEADYANTAYGALVEHSADSRGIALAYRALCDAVEIPCLVVRGSVGNMGTQEHFWNIIEIGGDYYHVDVSQFAFDPHYAFLISDDDLWGTYIWDTADYPACSGALRYTDLVPQPTDEPENDVRDGEAAESEAEERVSGQETEIKTEESKNIA